MGQTIVRIVTVVNSQGLHARPADMFVRLARQYQAKVEIVRDNERLDGKSIFNILTLAAMQGTQLSLECTGDDAEAAADALAALFASGFGEEECVS